MRCFKGGDREKKREEKEKGRCSMKKILVSLLVLAVCAPAMAVTVTLTEPEDGKMRATYALEVGETEVYGLVLKISTDGATIDDTADIVLNDFGPTTANQFNTFVDWAADGDRVTLDDGYVDESDIGVLGHPLGLVVPDAVNDEFELDPTGGVTEFVVTLAYLDQDGDATLGEGMVPTVDSFFDVFFDLTVASVVTVTAETSRGPAAVGKVGEATDSYPVTIIGGPITIHPAGCTGFPCCVDFNLTKKKNGGVDPVVNVLDLNAFISYVNGAKNGATFVVGPADPDFDPDYNFDASSPAINVLDLNAMINFVNTWKTGATFIVNCNTCAGC